MEQELNARIVRGLLDYDPDTGAFRWHKPKGRANRTERIGCPTKAGYLRIGIGGKSYYAHRLVWMHVFGRWPTADIDHLNGDPTDNRLVNLREISHAHNTHNVKTANRNSTTKLLGVTQAGGRFKARIAVAGKVHHLGSFATAEEAHAAYIDAKRKLHPMTTL